MYQRLKREEMLQQIISQQGPFIHQNGPAKGQPFGRRLLNRVLANWICEQKKQGTLIENRPLHIDQEGKTRKPRIFTRVPTQMEIFTNLNPSQTVDEPQQPPARAARPRMS